MACAASPSTQKPAEPSLSLSDFEPILGDDWTGNLTYLNYGEPVKDFTIPAEINVTVSEDGVSLYFLYPDEPQQNGGRLIKLSEDGTMLGSERIMSIETDTDGQRIVITEEACEDMGKPATCTMTYSLGQKNLILKKMVLYDGAEEAFRRNEYAFSR